MIKRRRWTADEDALLRRRYPHEPTAPLARALGRQVCGVYQHARAIGLEKTAAYMASPDAYRLRRGGNVGAACRFPKGHVPANKGLRRPGWAPGRMKDTQFKKGGHNHNTMPIGAERLVDGYRYVKVEAVRYVPYTVNWLPVHILEWERANGRPLPAGHCLWFRDGDRLNVDLDNLELITRAQNMARNTVHTLPKPIAQAVQLIGALNRQIRKRTKHGEEQDRRSA